MGFGTNAAITLHYSFLKELVGGDYRSRMTIGLQITFSLGVSLISFLCMMISTWKIVLGVFIIIPSLILFLGLDFFIQETPNLSLRKGKEVLLDSLNKIASINRNDPLTIDDLTEVLQGG